MLWGYAETSKPLLTMKNFKQFACRYNLWTEEIRQNLVIPLVNLATFVHS